MIRYMTRNGREAYVPLPKKGEIASVHLGGEDYPLYRSEWRYSFPHIDDTPIFDNLFRAVDWLAVRTEADHG